MPDTSPETPPAGRPARNASVRLRDTERRAVLNRHHFKEGREWTTLDAKIWCQRCDQEFSGREARIFRNERFADGFEVGCGTAGCDGNPLFFAETRWWAVAAKVTGQGPSKPRQTGNAAAPAAPFERYSPANFWPGWKRCAASISGWIGSRVRKARR